MTAGGIPLDSLNNLEPEADGWHSRDSILAALRRRSGAAARDRATPSATAPWGDGDPVAWAFDTGRITASSAPEWRARLAGDRAGTSATLRSLAPVLAAGVGRVPDVAASPPRPKGYRNAVEELRQNHPSSVAAAEQAVPPPELFAGSGDFAVATASGIEPAALNGLPWRARLAAAWASSRSEAFRLTQDFGGPDGDYAAFGELSGHPAVKAYVGAVLAWFGTAGVDPFAGADDQLTSGELARLFGPNATGEPLADDSHSDT
jgi:hypothetical protein